MNVCNAFLKSATVNQRQINCLEMKLFAVQCPRKSHYLLPSYHENVSDVQNVPTELGARIRTLLVKQVSNSTHAAAHKLKQFTPRVNIHKWSFVFYVVLSAIAYKQSQSVVNQPDLKRS